MSDQAKMGMTWASPMQQARNAGSEKPTREWQGLTDDEICVLVREASRGSALRRDGSTSLRIARAIEAKLKEKNT